MIWSHWHTNVNVYILEVDNIPFGAVVWDVVKATTKKWSPQSNHKIYEVHGDLWAMTGLISTWFYDPGDDNSQGNMSSFWSIQLKGPCSVLARPSKYLGWPNWVLKCLIDIRKMSISRRKTSHEKSIELTKAIVCMYVTLHRIGRNDWESYALLARINLFLPTNLASKYTETTEWRRHSAKRQSKLLVFKKKQYSGWSSPPFLRHNKPCSQILK